MSHKLFWREMTALIQNFTSEIIILPWQLYYIAKMSSCFENVTDFVTHDIDS